MLNSKVLVIIISVFRQKKKDNMEAQRRGRNECAFQKLDKKTTTILLLYLEQKDLYALCEALNLN